LLDFSRSGDRSTVPVGLSLVKTFVLPTLALQVQFAGYINVVRPDGAPQWLFRTQFTISSTWKWGVSCSAEPTTLLCRSP
jgi:hypothetical protein